MQWDNPADDSPPESESLSTAYRLTQAGKDNEMITKNLIGRRVTVLQGEEIEGNATIKGLTEIEPDVWRMYDDCKIWYVYVKVRFDNEPHESYLRWVFVSENLQTGICDPLLYERGKAVFAIPNTIIMEHS